MKENHIPYSLSQILFTVPESDFRPTDSALSQLSFDNRRDFVVAGPDPILAINMIFANDRCFAGDLSRGIRRKVLVSLTDTDAHRLLASTVVSINIERGCLSRTETLWLPVEIDDDIPSLHFAVEVRDMKTGYLFTRQALRFFSRFPEQKFITDMLKPVEGGIVPNFSTALYKSFDAEVSAYHQVRFYLEPQDRDNLPRVIPEMEVRIYFPDGTIESRIVAPVTEFDSCEGELYRILTPVYMTDAKKGISYAELVCLDEAIAGFVFNTAGEITVGSWHGKDMAILEEYSLEEAFNRFRAAIDGEGDKTSDDEFEKALDQFIKSQLEEDEGAIQDEQPAEEQEEPEPAPEKEEETVSPLKSLDNLTGLRSVKEKLTAYEKLVLFNKKRRDSDLPTLSLPLHAMFCGSPGTGKTTVAKRMGLMLKRAGVLSKGHVVVRERSTLLGQYYSNEETNTRAAIEEAQGGILFIDEAYQLHQPNDPRDPGKFVIETLMTALADESMRDWMLILAGYTDEMKRMFEMNPGLKSRIPDSNIYIFEDFTEPELMEIAERYLERHHFSMTPDAHSALARRLSNDYTNRSRSFGNARHVINMIQSEILPSMATRVVTSNNFDESALTLIQSDDIPQPKQQEAPKRFKIGYRA